MERHFSKPELPNAFAYYASRETWPTRRSNAQRVLAVAPCVLVCHHFNGVLPAVHLFQILLENAGERVFEDVNWRLPSCPESQLWILACNQRGQALHGEVQMSDQDEINAGKHWEGWTGKDTCEGDKSGLNNCKEENNYAICGWR